MRLVLVQDSEADLLATSPSCPSCGHLAALHGADDVSSYCTVPDCGDCYHNPHGTIGPHRPPTDAEMAESSQGSFVPPTWLVDELARDLLSPRSGGIATIAGYVNVSRDLLNG